ncbi:hypothetical protein [Nocardia sp. NPDC052112]|uniref:hypothetical protein n=1 Tax=Nocardia sp. NPDC052112 TaxID=3155646 RepID=UPI003432D2D6
MIEPGGAVTALALVFRPTEFAADRVVGIDGRTLVWREIPARGVWQSCRDLLLDVAGDDEITAVGIAAAGRIRMRAGVVAPAEILEWRAGFGIVAAVQRIFPVAAVQLAPCGMCTALAARGTGAAASGDVLAGAGLLALLAEDYAIRHSSARDRDRKPIGQHRAGPTGPRYPAACVRPRPR